MPNNIISYYDQHASHFDKQYNSVPARGVHADWAHLLSEYPPGFALDVGAGSGRDALWLAEQGWKVTAVEPATGLRERGQNRTSFKVDWVPSQLPSLSGLVSPARGYDLILLSAVWMHLTHSERPKAFARLVDLLAPEGMLVMTLRFGPSDPARPMYPVTTDELEGLAVEEGVQILILNDSGTEDLLKRDDVSWQTVCIRQIREPKE